PSFERCIIEPTNPEAHGASFQQLKPEQVPNQPSQIASTMSAPRTMFEKIWDAHVVHSEPGKPALLYIDLHLVHEVTSAQAFEGLRLAGRKVRRPELTVAPPDHNVPTTDRRLPIADAISKHQIDT